MTDIILMGSPPDPTGILTGSYGYIDNPQNPMIVVGEDALYVWCVLTEPGMMYGVLKRPENLTAIHITSGPRLVPILQYPEPEPQGTKLLDVRVSRHEWFYPTSGKALHYSESYPPESFKGRVLCCSEDVNSRPIGTPDQNQEWAGWEGKIGEYTLECNLSRRTINGVQEDADLPRFTLRWNHKKDHAYFWWHKNHLQVEITGTGENEGTNCTFIRMYFGNKVDISRLYHGHSPSKIVDLSALKGDDIWVHDDFMTHEGMSILPPGTEKTNLWRFACHADRIQDFFLAAWSKGSLKEVQEALVASPRLQRMIFDQFCWYIEKVENLQNTEMYRAMKKAECP